MKNRTENYMEKLRGDQRVKQMRNYVQHGKVSTYDHVFRVARISLAINRRLKIQGDERTLIRGAILHDYYLYDWHKDKKEGLHGFRHPERALERADKDFDLNEKEKNIIRSHMWPLTLLHAPKHREAWVVCAADKIASIKETLLLRKEGVH